MKKLWWLASVAALSLTACNVSTSSDDQDPPPPPPANEGAIHATRNLTTDYVTIDKGTFSSSAYMVDVRSGSCKEEGGKLVWSTEDVMHMTFDYFANRDSVVTNSPEGAESWLYGIDGQFPYGNYYKADEAFGRVAEGLILGHDQSFKLVNFVDTECPFEDLFIGPYIASEITEANEKDLNIGCNDAKYRGLTIALGEFTSETFKFNVSFRNKTCNIDVRTRFEFIQEDCNAAYSEYLSDRESGEIEPSVQFDFDENQYAATADDDCIGDLLVAWKVALDDPNDEININLSKKAPAKRVNLKKVLGKIVDGLRGK